MTQTNFYSDTDTLWNLDWLDPYSPLTSDMSEISYISGADISVTTTTTDTTEEAASAFDQHSTVCTDEYLEILAVDPSLLNYLPITPSPEFPPLSATASIPLSDSDFWLPTPASSPTCTPEVSEITQSPLTDLTSEIKCAKRKYKLLDDHELKICLYPAPPPRRHCERESSRERKPRREESCPPSQWVMKTPDDADELLTEVAISGTTLKKLRAEEQRTGKELVPRKKARYA